MFDGWRNQHATVETDKAVKRRATRICLGCGVTIAAHGNKKRCAPCAYDRSKQALSHSRNKDKETAT